MINKNKKAGICLLLGAGLIGVGVDYSLASVGTVGVAFVVMSLFHYLD